VHSTLTVYQATHGHLPSCLLLRVKQRAQALAPQQNLLLLLAALFIPASNTPLHSTLTVYQATHGHLPSCLLLRVQKSPQALAPQHSLRHCSTTQQDVAILAGSCCCGAAAGLALVHD
jgi:hypothetical protein